MERGLFLCPYMYVWEMAHPVLTKANQPNPFCSCRANLPNITRWSFIPAIDSYVH